MDDPTLCCSAVHAFCDRCDVTVGVEGVHVTAAERDEVAGWWCRWSRRRR